MQQAQALHPPPPSHASASRSPPPPLDYNDPQHYSPHRWPHTAIPRHVSYPLLFTYLFLGIAQSLPTTAVSFLMIRPPLSFSPALLTTTYNLWFQLGITRPVFSLLSDHYPILRYRRRPYLLLACLLCIVCSLLMASEAAAGSTAAFIALGAGVSLWWAVAEAMVDGAVVEMGNEQVQQAISRLGLEDRNREEQRQRRREYGLDTADSPPRAQSASASGSELRQSLLSPSPAPSSSSSSSRSAFGRYSSPIDLITQRIKARLQSECMAVRTTATIIASAISIALLRWAQRDYREVVAFTAIAFLPAIIAAFFITERKAKVAWYGLAAVHVDGTAAIADTDSEEEAESLSSSSSSLLQRAEEDDARPPSPLTLSAHNESELPASRPVFLRAKLSQLWSSLRLAFSPLLFIFLYYAVPSADDAYYYFLYSGDFPFEAWQADLFAFVGLLAALLGTLVYARFLSSLPVARLFLITTLLSTAASSLRFLLLFRVTFLFFAAPPTVFIPVTAALASFIAAIGNMLPIILAHTHSPSLLGTEATTFSLFQAADRLGVLVSGGLSAALTTALGIERGRLDALWLLMLLSLLLGLLPLPLVPLLLRKGLPPDTTTEMEMTDRTGKSKDTNTQVRTQHAGRQRGAT